MADINIRAPFSSRASVQFSVKNATLLKNSAEELPIVAEFLGISHLTNYIDFSMELAKQYNNLKCIIMTRGADGAYALDCKTGKKLSGIRRKRWRGDLPQEAENRRRKSFDFRRLFYFYILLNTQAKPPEGRMVKSALSALVTMSGVKL